MELLSDLNMFVNIVIPCTGKNVLKIEESNKIMQNLEAYLPF
jgi:hypothetical protein